MSLLFRVERLGYQSLHNVRMKFFDWKGQFIVQKISSLLLPFSFARCLALDIKNSRRIAAFVARVYCSNHLSSNYFTSENVLDLLRSGRWRPRRWEKRSFFLFILNKEMRSSAASNVYNRKTAHALLPFPKDLVAMIRKHQTLHVSHSKRPVSFCFLMVMSIQTNPGSCLSS